MPFPSLITGTLPRPTQVDLVEDDDLRSPCVARVLSHLEKRGSGMEQEAVAVRILKLGLDVPGVAGFVALAVVVGHDIPE